MSVFSTLKIITCYNDFMLSGLNIYWLVIYAAAAAAVMAATMKLSFKIYIICTDVEWMWENMLLLAYI